MAVSGVIDGSVRIPPSRVCSTTAAGPAGGGQVRRAVPCSASSAGGSDARSRRAAGRIGATRACLVRLALDRGAAFGVTFGIAVGFGRTPPPPLPTGVPSISDVEIGYDFAGPPTPARVLLDWRFDLIFGTAALLFAALYLAGVRRLRRRGDRVAGGPDALLAASVFWCCCSSARRAWAATCRRCSACTWRRTCCCQCWCRFCWCRGAPSVLGVAGTAEPPGAATTGYAGMDTGRPAQQALEIPDRSGGRHGVVRRRRSTGSIWVACSTSRWVATSGISLMNVHFLLSGYLFYWVVIGVDPTPRPIPPIAKLGVVFASLPLHAFFGIVLMGMEKVLGGSFYRSLHLSWHTDLLGDQRLGGGIAWAAGEIPLVLVMIALLVQWSRSDRRTARRLDRAADRDEGCRPGGLQRDAGRAGPPRQSRATPALTGQRPRASSTAAIPFTTRAGARARPAELSARPR